MWDFLFGKTKDQYDADYAKAIKDTKQSMADSVYQDHYNKALYDANKDYFDKIGVQDPSAYYYNDKGQYTNALSDTMNWYNKYLNDLSNEREAVAKQNKYNIFGDGVIGGLLNPFHQGGTAIQDFVSSGTKEWDNGNRDALSDIGALGESALMLAPVAGSGIKALKGAGAVAKGAETASKLGKVGNAVKSFTTAHPLASQVGKTALGMGGWSGLGALTDYGSDIGEHIPETAFRVGTGMALGGATGALGYGVNKLAQRAQGARALSNLYQDYMNQQGTGVNMIGDGVGGASITNAQQTPATEWLTNRGKLARTKLGQAVQGVGDTISYKRMMGNSLGNKVKDSRAGNAISNLLKTKKGKVIAGAGGGLLLAQLLKNNNSGGE